MTFSSDGLMGKACKTPKRDWSRRPQFALVVIILLTCIFGMRVLNRARATQKLVAAVLANNSGGAVAALDDGADPDVVFNWRDEGMKRRWSLRQWITYIVPGRREHITGESTYISAPIVHAAGWRNYAIVLALLKHGANINGIRYKSPLDTAAHADDFIMVQFFVERGARINHTGALQTAAMMGNKRIILYLLAHGADINEQFGPCTALSMVQQQRNAEMTGFLKSLGATDYLAQGAKTGSNGK